ncbi:hypothetical protein BZA77DRAFT_388265 [Pyronema omphalodes]|nr:hypothetical protein BZA77DRAFT_388265 [Pyronema omphalodes]
MTSITQTFYLAHKARSKLSQEANRSDHNLRLLVGHANLLDSLMIHINTAEAEQEKWYYNTVRSTPSSSEEYGSLAADYSDDSSDSESEVDSEEDYSEYESESDYDEEEFEEIFEDKIISVPTKPARRTSFTADVCLLDDIEESEEEEDSEEEQEEEDYETDYATEEELEEEGEEEDGMYTLTRTTSHRPPSLCSDESDEESDSELPSPTIEMAATFEQHATDYFSACHRSSSSQGHKDLLSISSYYDSRLSSPTFIDDRLATLVY